MAAYGALMQIWNYVQMPGSAVSTAVTAVASQTLGARQYDRIAAVMRSGQFCGILLTGLVVVVVESMNTEIITLFLPVHSPAVLIASHLNREVTWSFVLVAVGSVIFSVMNAAGNVWLPLGVQGVVLAVRCCAISVSLSRFGVEAIWWSFPIVGVAVGILAAVCYRWNTNGKWKRLNQVEVF